MKKSPLLTALQLGWLSANFNKPQAPFPATPVHQPANRPPGALKWCGHCRKSDHDDAECWSTRVVMR